MPSTPTGESPPESRRTPPHRSPLHNNTSQIRPAGPATRETRCPSCKKPTSIGQDLVVKMKRPPKWFGDHLHRDCAEAFFRMHPPGAADGTPIVHEPEPQVSDALTAYVRGDIKKLEMDSIAGCGKSNAIVYTAKKLREAGLSFVVFVFNVAAKESLLDRGLYASEVFNFHSYGYRAYSAWVRHYLGHEGQAAPASRLHRRGEEVHNKGLVCPNATGLILRFCLRDHQRGKMLTVLYRPFVKDLVDKARAQGVGLPDGPLFFDREALMRLVEKYGVQPKLEATWRAAMTHPEKQAIDLAIGAGPEVRLEFGVELAMHVLDLGVQWATNLEVDGHDSLVGDKGDVHRAPFTDWFSMVHVPAMRGHVPKLYDRVLMDEGQDMNAVHIKIATDALAPGGSLLWVGDRAQSVYLFSGVEVEKQEEMLEGSVKVYLNKNFRSCRSVISETQEVLERMGRTITIEGVRDVQGKVVSAPFYLEPIDLNHSTLIVGRNTRDLLTFYRALLERGYPVVMHGIPDTARELMDCLSEMNQNNGPLEYVRERLDLAIDAQSGIAAPASHSYEQVTALKGLLEIYLEEDSDVNTSLPESSHAFSKWIDKFFKPGEAEKGVVRMTTAHAGKGLEADDVFIVNPSMFPLQERIDLGGWAEFEELCVEYVAKSRARDRMVYLPDLEVSSKDEVFRLLDKPKVRAMDASASSQPYASSSQDTTLTEALDDTEDTTEKDAALATLELQALPETEQDLDDRVRSMLRAVMKRPRSSSQPHGPTAAAVRMQADTRAKEITGARNVLRDAIRSGGK